MSNSAVGSISGASAANPSTPPDPSTRLDAAVKRLLQKSDADGDGQRSAQELTGLSADAFKALDTNGDGKLSADELKTGMKKAMDEMKQARSSADPRQAISALQNTPEGQLMQQVRGHHHHRHHGVPAQTDQTKRPSPQIGSNPSAVNPNDADSPTTPAATGIDVRA